MVRGSKFEELAKNTRTAYLTAVDSFKDFLAEYEPEYVTAITLQDYKQSMVDEKERNTLNPKKSRAGITSNNTINLRLSVINRMFNNLGYPDIRVKSIKDTTNNIDAGELTESDYQKLIYWADRLGKEKIKMIIKVLTGTGIRISELRFLTYESLKTGMFTVNNKGKTRYVFLPDGLVKELRRYCRNHKNRKGEKDPIKSGIIFYGRTDADGFKNPIDQSYIRRELKTIAGKARGTLKSKTHPHAFRKIFARRYTETEGTNPLWLSLILGHSINITQYYSKPPTTKELKDMVNLTYEKFETAVTTSRKKKRK